MKVTQVANDGETTDHMHLLTTVLLGLGSLFFLIFFVYWSSGNAGDEVSEDLDLLFYLLVTSTVLTITLLITQFYHAKTRGALLLKYSVLLGNGIVLGFAIHEMLKGSGTLFGPDPQDSVEQTYAGLAVGFSGIATVLGLVHNAYGLSRFF